MTNIFFDLSNVDTENRNIPRKLLVAVDARRVPEPVYSEYSIGIEIYKAPSNRNGTGEVYHYQAADIYSGISGRTSGSIRSESSANRRFDSLARVRQPC